MNAHGDARRMEVRIPAGLRHVRLAVSSIRAAATSGGLGEREAGQLSLAAAEALNNVVLHALEEREDQWISVEFAMDSDEVALVLRDQGRPMPEASAAAPLEFDEADPDSLPEGGFGRGLLRDLLTRVHYERVGGENVLTLVYPRSGAVRMPVPDAGAPHAV